MSRFSSETLVSRSPDQALRACVIVPARNEEDLLPGALHALAEQKQLNGGALGYETYEVILLLNNTSDGSRQAADRVACMYPSFRLHIVDRWFKPAQAHIGRVRRLLMDEACCRLEATGTEGGLILSTDSDTRVAPNWIAANRREIELGAEAVGGRVVVSGSDQALLDSNTRHFRNQDHVYRRLVSWLESQLDPEEHDPWPRHHYHFGASLAVTPRTYKHAGKLPPRRCLEDVAFYQQMLRYDIKLRHSNSAKVYTSARLSGRTDFGLSRTLADVQRQGTNPAHVKVESKQFLEFLFRTRHELRASWNQRKKTESDEFRQLAHTTGINQSALIQELYAARYFGALLERVCFYEACRGVWPDCRRLSPLTRAVEDLFALFKQTTKPPRRAIHYQSTS